MTPKQIAISIAAGAGLVIVGATAWAISQAVAALIAAHTTMFGLLALSTAVIVLLGGARILLAIGAQQRAKAWQNELSHLPNGLPIHFLDVRELRTLVEPSVIAHGEAERIRAAVPPATHWHQEIHAAPALPLLNELLSVSAPPAAQLPQLPAGNGPQLAHLQQIGHVCRSGNSLLVGYADGAPQYIELSDCGFIGIGGKPRVGKSVTASLLIDQAVLSGWQVFVGDPHANKADGLLSRLQPLAAKLRHQAVTPAEIAEMVRTVDRIGRRRVEGRVADRTPIILVLDEFSNMVWRKDLPPDVLAILPSMAVEYAGVGVHGVLIAHDWSKSSLGNDLGAALRRALTHRIIHRMDPGNVEFLLPASGASAARTVQGLAAGQVLYNGPDGTVTAMVPLVGDDDAAYAAQHAPERPKVLRSAQPSTAPLPAPTPAGTQAHLLPDPPAPTPTEKLPEPTIQEQIVMLLDVVPWRTSSEIAERLGVDVQVVRVELNKLWNRRSLSRREAPAEKSDRYEWSLSKPLNDLMAERIAISA